VQVPGGNTSGLETDAVAGALSDSSFDARASALALARQHFNQSEKLMVSLRARSKDADARASGETERSQAEFRAAATRLRTDLGKAEAGEDASAWGGMQASLAADYRSYAKAYSAAEAGLNIAK
jgi:cytochrome c556